MSFPITINAGSEKFDWVDQRLQEMYHGYAFTSDNCDDFMEAGLLGERWSWVDQRLEELYYGYALTAENCDEYQDAGLLTQKWAWADCKLEETTQPLVSILGKRKFDETDFASTIQYQHEPSGNYFVPIYNNVYDLSIDTDSSDSDDENELDLESGKYEEEEDSLCDEFHELSVHPFDDEIRFIDATIFNVLEEDKLDISQSDEDDFARIKKL